MIQEQVEEDIYEAQLVEEANHYCQNNKKKLNEYEVKEELGRGSFGKVKRVTRCFKDTETSEVEYEDYAMKIFNRSVLEHQRTCFYEHDNKNPRMTTIFEFALNEINIWKYLNHKNICKMYQIIDDPEDAKDNIYIVMQLGDLGCIMDFDERDFKFKRSEKVIKFLNQPSLIQTAKLIFKQVALAIEYLHKHEIVNRDIKVDNIIGVSTKNLDESIKLTDFSTARYCKQGYKFYDCAGTAGFRPPEVQFNLNDGYDPFKLDIWSFGISLYIYLHEQMPFWGESELEIDLKARDEQLIFKIDDEILIDLIQKCCQKDASKRLNIDQILQHKWFQ